MVKKPKTNRTPLPQPKKEKLPSPREKARRAKDPTREVDYREAASIGLSLPNYRVLRCLSCGEVMNYNQINEKTGYYASLTEILRKSKERSLESLDLVRQIKDPKIPVLQFQITKRGLSLLRKVNKSMITSG